jgi:TPR repeat protein
MSLLTLKISVSGDSRISYVLLSLDPNVRMVDSAFEIALTTPFSELQKFAMHEVSTCLHSGNKLQLEKIGVDLAKLLFPEKLTQWLMSSNESYLYLDLDDDAITIPWECVRIGDDFVGTRFIVGRHVRVTDAGKVNLRHKVQRYTIVTNPDGTLPEASSEGTVLKNTLPSTASADVLNLRVSKNEACEFIASCDVFHFAGHSDSTGLKFNDDYLTGDDVDALSVVPRLVFLNSCDSGNIRNWDNLAVPVMRAFLQAGTRAIIVSTVPVQSVNASKIAAEFYLRLQGNESLGDCLKGAGDKSGDDLAWARYVIYGHPQFRLNSITKSPKKIKWPILIAAASAIVIVLSLLMNHFRAPKVVMTEEELIHDRSCASGSASDCEFVGKSLSAKGDINAAISYLNKSCDQGRWQSCYLAAKAMVNGGRIDQALDKFKSLCLDSKDNYSCAQAAFIFESKADLVSASNYSRLGCELGLDLACISNAKLQGKIGNFAEAIKILQGYCRAGMQVGSCTDLGTVYVMAGKIDDAVKAFARDCNAREGELTGLFCETAGAETMTHRRKVSQDFFRRACALGRTSACVRVEAKAASAANPCGNLDSSDCHSLAYKFQTNGDLDRADAMYRSLCSKGFLNVCNDVGALEKKRGDVKAATRTFRRLCDLNGPMACYNLAIVSVEAGSSELALISFKKSCLLAYGPGCAQAADIFKRNGDVPSQTEFFRLGCEHDEPSSCNNYAILKSKEHDKVSEMTALHKACDLGLSLGCRNLANNFEDAGASEKAKDVLSRTCKKGDVLSCDRLKSAVVGH